MCSMCSTCMCTGTNNIHLGSNTTYYSLINLTLIHSYHNFETKLDINLQNVSL